MFTRVNLLNQVLWGQRFACASTKAAVNKPIPVITCKNTKFNLMKTDDDSASVNPQKEIELASKGWQHHKSKGDHFIIHPIRDVVQSNLENSKNVEDLELNEQLKRNLSDKHGIFKVTKLQKEAIDEISAKHNVLIAAETGCGKTHAYLLPIINKLQQIKAEASDPNERQFNSPLALILTPGRELAEQIGKFAEDLSEGLDLNVKVITGGNTKRKMMYPSFEDVDILIGSIGAISKLTTTGIYRMSEIRHVVLDEADTMLDDSFNEKLCYFLQRFHFHSQTQLILASATMPTNTESAFREIIDTDTLKKVVSDDLHKILPYVTQKFIRTNKTDRPENLLRIVRNEVDKKRPVIVFSNKSATSDYINIFLNNNGVNCLNLNGDMLMKIREGRFQQFQDGAVSVLSTTDCVARGLNTVRARHIINFDFPLHVSDYIHRCGRIGRLGSSNNCIITNFISSFRELDLVRQIEKSARTNYLLENVDANIRSIIQQKIEKEINKYEKMEMDKLKASM